MKNLDEKKRGGAIKINVAPGGMRAHRTRIKRIRRATLKSLV
jgi:hypothetical protein